MIVAVHIKVEAHCKTCGAFIPKMTVVWYDWGCGCAYCSTQCRDAAKEE